MRRMAPSTGKSLVLLSTAILPWMVPTGWLIPLALVGGLAAIVFGLATAMGSGAIRVRDESGWFSDFRQVGRLSQVGSRMRAPLLVVCAACLLASILLRMLMLAGLS